MPNIPTGDPDSSHLEDAKYLNDGKKQLKTSITGKPTYWPSDRNKLPDLVDFCVTKGIPQDLAVAKSCPDLSSDHSPVLITVQLAGWNATPEHKDALKIYDCPVIIKQKIEEKRRLPRDWHRLRTPESKRLLNTATQELEQLLNRNKNDSIQTRSYTNGIHRLFLVESDQKN
jgi:hypothetical protein